MTRSLRDLDVTGRVVLVRCDLNVPLDTSGGVATITDDGRIRASVPTLSELSRRGARVVVLSHLGRPKGVVDPRLSLRPVAHRLAELLGRPVAFVPSVTGDEVARAIEALRDGDVIVLENVRFDPRETSKDARERAELAGEWAGLAQAFVSDGFGVVHREQASVTDVARLLPAAAGLLVQSEVASFDRVLHDPARPYVVALGGSKVADKIAVIEHLLDRVDTMLIGGGMAFTFLHAIGRGIGKSLLDESMIPTVIGILERAKALGVTILLPVDVVVADRISVDAQVRVVDVDSIPEDMMGLDIGPRTVALFAEVISAARTVVWNGPMGVFEMSPFAEGTRSIAAALADSAAFTVVGGGDSAAAIRLLGLNEERFGHISTGGGASLELLEGRELPGLAVLHDDGRDSA